MCTRSGKAGTRKQAEKVFVGLAKQQIKDTPEFDREKRLGDLAYRDEVGTYYGTGGATVMGGTPFGGPHV
ncbi:hypothetical protein [Streptomyces mangrovisoli]|uniref:Uncharacterized protein n=1 Tax=Streptomyces mangrovisoli TaxID=1428628 RepID=A0A1J4NY39_9ACTN|nr:hypothetical protein [Streptomyces mangrovisoli]OIJ66046.1 hypothetical protein WN71_020490 [Streptomyces mangrovisoli]